MTRAVIVHGTGGTPDVVWLPWLAQRLAARGWQVDRPHFPDVNVTPVAEFLPGALARMAVDAETVLRESYDWDRIAAHVDDLVLINSVTDPYGCDWRQGMAIRDRVGGTLVIRDEGHFVDWDQEFDEFPLLDRLIHD